MIAGFNLVIAMGVWVPKWDWVVSLEGITWDYRATLLARPGRATSDVVLIVLDQDSLDWVNDELGYTWKWPRTVYTPIIDFCTRYGAKAVVFDVLFTEPSPYGVEDDTTLGESIKANGRFIAGSIVLSEQTGKHTKWPKGLTRPHIQITGLEKWLESEQPARMAFSRATFPIGEVYFRAFLNANVTYAPDIDRVYRRVTPFQVFDGKVVPSLGLGAYLAAYPDTDMTIEHGGFHLGATRLPIDRDGQVILNFRGRSRTHATYSAAQVIQSEMRLKEGRQPVLNDPLAFKDKFVFFGFTAPALLDLRPTPVDPLYPGVQIHATFLDNVLSEDIMRPMPAGMTLSLIGGLTAICAFTLLFLPSGLQMILAAGLFFLVPLGAALFAFRMGLWMPVVVTEIAIVSTILDALAVNYATEGHRRRYIKNAFQQYLNPKVIDQLIKHPERLKLGGERRHLSMFFSDLEGFTSISEGLAPEDLTALLNDYLSAMTDIIQDEEGGTVDKYEGDAIIAFWNAPIALADHALHAVRAALRCQQRLREMRPQIEAKIGKTLKMRIGINTGEAIVGNFGSRTKFDYTMLGDAVNLAARLEGINKQFGTYTMISQATQKRLGTAFAFRELARVIVVGRGAAVTVYEPMLLHEYEAQKKELRSFARALNFFYKGEFMTALDLFAAIKDRDPPSAAYYKKCRVLIDDPPDNWSGVWKMESK